MEDPSTEDGSSIYDDLMCQGDLGLVIHNLQTRNKQLQLHVTSLEEDIRKLCNKITEMKQTQENLSRNISELYKTAKNEIARKDRLIAELQSRLDDMIFKRNTAPSNFGIKRQREEQTHSEDMYKKPKCDVKSAQNREPKKESSVRESELSRSDYHNKDKKSESEISKNYRSSDTRDHMKIRNNPKNLEKRNDSRDPLRYERDSRRSSNSRNYRRDDESNFRKRYIDKERRSSRDRDYKEDRFGESKELKNKNEKLRNERSNRGRERRSFDREDNGSNRDLKNEPRFSPIESTRSTPEPPLAATNDILNVSREEGEILDVDEDKRTLPSNKGKNNHDNGKKIYEKNIVSRGIKKDPPGDKIQASNTSSKCIDEQQNIIKKKETEIKNIERNINNKELPCTKIHDDENQKDDLKDMVKYSNKNTIQSMNNTTDKKSSVEESEEKISSINEDCLEQKGKSCEAKEVKTEKITIISQVVLNESKIENIKSNAQTKPKSGESTKILKKETTKIADSTHNQVVKINKPTRECGVPRNLTGELNINLEKSRPKHDKESDINKTERVKQKISSLFDTPIKETKQCSEKSINFKQTFDVTHDGGIPELEFSKTDAKDTSSFHSAVGIKETSTPVSEFQIFKTNLPCLEKSNNVSIQFQKNTSNISVNTAEVTTLAINESEKLNTDETKLCVEGCLEQKSSVERLQKPSSEDLVNTSHPVKNENVGYGNTSDMCNISLDLLNTNLGVYKVEDFPNLTAFSESRDMPNILLTPVSNCSKKKEGEIIKHTKLSDVEIISKEQNTSLIVSIDEKVILQEKNESESRSTVCLNDTGVRNTSSNTTLSPNSSDSRRKRKRCVIKWAE